MLNFNFDHTSLIKSLSIWRFYVKIKIAPNYLRSFILFTNITALWISNSQKKSFTIAKLKRISIDHVIWILHNTLSYNSKCNANGIASTVAGFAFYSRVLGVSNKVPHRRKLQHLPGIRSRDWTRLCTLNACWLRFIDATGWARVVFCNGETICLG